MRCLTRRGFATAKVDLFINDRKVTTNAGTTILQAAAEAGIEIPR